MNDSTKPAPQSAFPEYAFRQLKKLPANHMRDIAAELAGLLDSEWNSIPEVVFKEVYLPLFVEGHKGNEALYEQWVGIAGNLRFGVHLYEGDDPSKRVLTVPPLIDTSMFDPSVGSAGHSIAAHTAVYDALLRNRPNMAVPYFQKNMLAILTEKLKKPTSKYWQMYADMLKFYGYDFTGKPTDTPAQGAEASQSKPVMIYDPDDVL